jgi:hypothetical protein
MDDEHQLEIIRDQLDKVFLDAHTVELQYRPIDFGNQMHLFCRGYCLAYVHAGIISPEKFDEFMKYCDKMKRGL